MTLEELRRQAQDDPTVENLRALRDALVGEMRALDEAAGDADLTDEQATRWQALDDEREQLEPQIEQAERRARVQGSRQRWRSTQFGSRVNPHDQGLNVRSLTARESRDRALALLDRDDPATRHLRDDQREQVERTVRAATGDLNGAIVAQRLLLTEHPDYREAFMRMVTDPAPVLTPEQHRALQAFEEFRAMSIGSDPAGGFGVPVLIDPTIILTAQGHPNDILGLARVETITTDVWKGVSSTGVTWKFDSEAAAATDNSPTLAQPTVTTHRADGYIPYSIEVGMDYPGFADEMSRLLDEGYSELLVDKLTTGAGSGSNEPRGILTALDANTNVEIKTATSSVITAADINGLWAALPIRYRNPAMADRQAWMMSTQVNGVIQQLGDDAGAAFTVNFTEEGVTVLKGRRAYENDYFDDLPSSGTGTQNLAVVGDWRNFLVAQRAGMNVELVPHVFDVTNNRPTGQRAWFAWARVGSNSINDLGFRLLKNNDGA